jgi:60 kDa SS-A/Ro ribonucleoprotein
MKYASHINPKNTPQTQPLMGENQIKNSAGGYVYAADDWAKLDRFLILGTEKGTYYADERKLTMQSATSIVDLIRKDGQAVVKRIAEVSTEGLAMKNAPAIFALALAVKHGDTDTKKAAMAALPKIARTSTDLFSFVDQYKNGLGGGTGAVVKAGLKNWYLEKTPEKLAYQMVKYRQRDGWTHHDTLHLAHPKASDEVTNSLFKFAKASAGKDILKFDTTGLPGIVVGYQEAMRAADANGIVKLIEQYNLPREAIPTEFLNDRKVWDAMLPNMPATALLRNLGKLTSLGIVLPMSEGEKMIVSKLGNAEWLQKSRIHPISVLVAALVYANGAGIKGSLTWSPSQAVKKALDKAFYASFKNVEPTGKNYLLGVDVSGSMSCGVLGMQIPGMNARLVAAAMALVIEATEQNTHIMGFSSNFVDLNINSNMRLEDVVRTMSGLPFDRTDCSLPMRYAEKHKIPVDGFVVITDNETFVGSVHPSVALRNYRQAMGRDSKSVVLATSVNDFTIADPKDKGMLDAVGFSADVPSVIANFMRS